MEQPEWTKQIEPAEVNTSIYNVEPTATGKTSKHAHTKIIEDIEKYVTKCKEQNKNCECTFTLMCNDAELDENKKWRFLYQCSDDKMAVESVNNITLSFLGCFDEAPKVELYK